MVRGIEVAIFTTKVGTLIDNRLKRSTIKKVGKDFHEGFIQQKPARRCLKNKYVFTKCKLVFSQTF